MGEGISSKIKKAILTKIRKTISQGLKTMKNRPWETFIALILILILGPPITQALGTTFGPFTAAGFTLSLIASFISGKMVKDPRRILYIFCGYVLGAAAMNFALEQILEESVDFYVMSIGLLVAAIIWLKGEEIKRW